MAQHKPVRRNYGEKFPVSIKYQNLDSFKEGMIHLCQSILETRRISQLIGSALCFGKKAVNYIFWKLLVKFGVNSFESVFQSLSKFSPKIKLLKFTTKNVLLWVFLKIWVFLGKPSPSNIAKCKNSCKTKKIQIWDHWVLAWKTSVIPEISTIKFAKMPNNKILKFGTKNTFFEHI